MNDPTAALDQLGDTLEAAVAADPARRRARRRRRMTVGAITAVGVLGVSGAVAAATGLFTTHEEVERGMPNGAMIFQGTTPTCTEVEPGIVFDCTLPDGPDSSVEQYGDYTNMAQALTDDTLHVSGGCRGQNADGTHWICYIGERAVEEQIIGPDFLGEYAPSPGVG